MADPIKFVQLDCHLDEKFEYIEAEFGLEGFAIIVKLLQRIYGGQGYYCEWSDRVALLFARKIGAGANVVREVVSSALKERIFDEEIFQKYGVLTSHGIQKRFAEVAKRRAVIFEKPEYVIAPCAQNFSNVCNQGSNVCNSDENVCNETTSKVKQSKVKQSKVKESEVKAATPPSPAVDRNFLIEKFGVENVIDYETRFERWKQKKHGVNVSMYETIYKWLQQDGVQKPINKSSFDMDAVMKKIIEERKKKYDA